MIIDLGTDGFNRFQRKQYRSGSDVKTRGVEVPRLRGLEAEHASSHREDKMSVDGLVAAHEQKDGTVELRFPDGELAYVEDATILSCTTED